MANLEQTSTVGPSLGDQVRNTRSPGEQKRGSVDPPRIAENDSQAAAFNDFPMRTLRADAQLNRERVLEAARIAFGTQGSDVSLDEIARSAGVGTGTVYRHFDSKEALFREVVLSRIDDLVTQATALAGDPDPGRALTSVVEYLSRKGARCRDLVEAFGDAGLLSMSLRSHSGIDTLTNLLTELLFRAQRCCRIRSDIGVDDVFALMTGTAYAICKFGADEEQTNRLLAIMCDGIRVRPVSGA